MKSLRGRITILSTLVLALVLALAAVLIVTLVDRSLRSDLAEQRDETMLEIAGRIEDGEEPSEILLPLGTDGTEYAIFEEGEFINSSVVFADFGLIDEDFLVDGEILVEDVQPPTTPFDSAFVDAFFADTEVWEETSTFAQGPNGQEYEVVAFSSIDIVERSVGQVRSVLLITIPVLALVFGGLVWLMAGRTLRPVDQITRRASEISTDTLHQRLEDPETNDEIGRLTRTLNTMLDRLDKGATQQRQFVSDASHELQSPLTVLIGEAELAAQSGDTEALAAANALVIEHGKRMSEMIHDLLELARAGENAIAKSDVDLDDVLHEQATMQPRDVTTSGISAVRIQGDERSLGRLFRNLIDNASRYAVERIEVSCLIDGNDAVVTVDDDGPGIPLADREIVFERFGRVDESRNRSTGGTGLGLAIAKAIVDAHGGTISVQDSPLGGAQMHVRLPLD